MLREPSATRQAIIDAAEELWARHGLDAVTLKQIIAHAGSANATAVQYHFGSRDGLLAALYQSRVDQLDAMRAQRLAQHASPVGLPDLLDCLYRPFADLVDRNGRHSYAAFLFGLACHDQIRWRFRFDIVSPATDHLIGLLRAHFPGLTEQEFNRRMFLASLVYWKAVCQLDDEPLESPADNEHFITGMIGVMETILRIG